MTIRITPAGAGKTYKLKDWKFFFQDHPRRCGENPVWAVYFKSFLGSPPQVRGKRPISLPSSLQTRITPAGAGKTGRKPVLQGLCQDHPRRCGENSISPIILSSFDGSPPQVRGKPSAVSAILSKSRITPAGAGKTNVKNS